jgi:glutamine amidotransferase
LADCITALKAGGLDGAVRDWIAADRPFLGVCLGLQALFDFSEEADTPGLGIFPGRVVRFKSAPGLKVPHMGWNTVRFVQPDSPLTRGLAPEGEAFYFVHSYHCVPADPALVLAECDYGLKFTAAIARGRCFATQFHPEKSQAKGVQLYRNFVTLSADA